MKTLMITLALLGATALAAQAQERKNYAEPYPYHKSSGAQGYQLYPLVGCEDHKTVGSATRQICNQRVDTRDAKQFWEFRDAQGQGTLASE